MCISKTTRLTRSCVSHGKIGRTFLREPATLEAGAPLVCFVKSGFSSIKVRASSFDTSFVNDKRGRSRQEKGESHQKFVNQYDKAFSNLLLQIKKQRILEYPLFVFPYLWSSTPRTQARSTGLVGKRASRSKRRDFLSFKCALLFGEGFDPSPIISFQIMFLIAHDFLEPAYLQHCIDHGSARW